MTWRIELVHTTSFRYASSVTASYNEARMTPATDLHQTTIRSQVETTPAAALQRYWDYWGTQVVAFDLHEPHEELTVRSTSVVETEAVTARPAAISWDQLADPQVTNDFDELLRPTDYVPGNGELGALAKRLRAEHDDPADAVLAAAAWTHEKLEYLPGVTSVHSSAVDALAEKRGVCQDFAHVTLSILRSMGVPSRYVSGYLYPVAESEPGNWVLGESHAWIEAWTGAWWGHDPTNDIGLDERHVTVARGRDYADVAPFHGTFSGGKSSLLGVTVELTRLR